MWFSRVGISGSGRIKKQRLNAAQYEENSLMYQDLLGTPRSPYTWHVDSRLPDTIMDLGRLVFVSEYPYSCAMATVWGNCQPLTSVALLSGRDRLIDESLLDVFGATLPEHLKAKWKEIPEPRGKAVLYSVELSVPIEVGIESGLAFVFFSWIEQEHLNS